MRRVWVALVLIVLVLVVQAILSKQPIPYRAQRTYTYYFPIFYVAPNTRKGVAHTGTCENAYSVGAKWSYAWTTRTKECPDLENIPMIRDGDSTNEPLGGNSNYLMLFNEPERKEQSNLTPRQAAELTRQIEAQHPDKLLTTPATMWGLGQHDIARQWMIDWRNEYINLYGEPPRISVFAYHWYGWTKESALLELESVIELAREWGITDVWLTEFSFLSNSETLPCWGHTLSETITEAESFFNAMGNYPALKRYAWFAPWIDVDAWYAIKPSQCPAPLIKLYTNELTPWGEFYKTQ